MHATEFNRAAGAVYKVHAKAEQSQAHKAATHYRSERRLSLKSSKSPKQLPQREEQQRAAGLQRLVRGCQAMPLRPRVHAGSEVTKRQDQGAVLHASSNGQRR